MEKQWSSELQLKMSELSGSQRRGIARIVMSEADGVPFSRLLRTVYSCKWCGREIGRNAGKADRKRVKLYHQEECKQNGTLWRFVCNYTTFYRLWRKSALFMECLEMAREETVFEALSGAARMLRLTTYKAVIELRRQVGEGERDIDRRSAAVAILDRADVSTAGKVDDGLAQWLDDLRQAEDSDGDDGD